ncbi:MAG: hypothetical protein RIQ33_991 [Bacteroidota bacterium]
MFACSISLSLKEIDSRIISYEVNPTKSQIQLFWKNDKGEILTNFESLKKHTALHHQKLLMAMNAGMFQEDFSPLGLYIENGKVLQSINLRKGNGNFYMEPNGIFFIDKKQKAHVISTKDFHLNDSVLYATQSGPMLLINEVIISKFTAGSKNVNVRNGVGIKPNGEVVFAISKEEINFYNFANYFKQMGCKNALYLDGFVSRMYLPSKNIEQIDGKFGVMICVVKVKN